MPASNGSTRRARAIKPARCPVYKTLCAEHGFTHGAEAEELRKGIENTIECSDPEDAASILNALRELLDQTDARDSLAYLEAKKRKAMR